MIIFDQTWRQHNNQLPGFYTFTDSSAIAKITLIFLCQMVPTFFRNVGITPFAYVPSFIPCVNLLFLIHLSFLSYHSISCSFRLRSRQLPAHRSGSEALLRLPCYLWHRQARCYSLLQSKPSVLSTHHLGLLPLPGTARTLIHLVPVWELNNNRKTKPYVLYPKRRKDVILMTVLMTDFHVSG